MGQGASAGAVDDELVIEVATQACRHRSPAGSEEPLARYLAGRLDALGFDVELQEVVAGRPNVVAVSRGSDEFESVMLNGHTDAPLPVGQWSREPFDAWIEDGKLYGAAVCDMKAALGSIVGGAAAAARLPPSRRGDIVVMFAMHHDSNGLGMKYFLENCGWQLDWGINGEPTSLAVQLFHGGSWGFELRTRGILRHQVRLEEGVNAVAGMARIVGALDACVLTHDPDPDHPELPRIVVGSISGGGGESSFTAEECVTRGNVRFLPSMTLDGMRADIRRVIGRVCSEMPGLTATANTTAFEWSYEMTRSSPAVEAVADAHRAVTGRPVEYRSGLPMSASVSDASDMVRHGIPTAMYGPGDWLTEPDEHIALDEIVDAARVYAEATAELVTRRRATATRSTSAVTHHGTSSGAID
jgi:acetylornithine deacetylase/succinyl-diaminopimelate desuccinylase-like protein